VIIDILHVFLGAKHLIILQTPSQRCSPIVRGVETQCSGYARCGSQGATGYLCSKKRGEIFLVGRSVFIAALRTRAVANLSNSSNAIFTAFACAVAIRAVVGYKRCTDTDFGGER